MDKTKTVSKVPKVTPKLIATNEERQKRWRKLYSAPLISIDAHAERVIKSNLDTLDQIAERMKHANNSTKAALKARSLVVRKDVSIWLASVGQFASAAQLAVKNSQRALYRDYAQAVKKDDAAWCEHPMFEQTGGGLQQVAYREFNFFSEEHARKISMVRCNTCGFRNAKDLNAELVKLQQFRDQVRAAANDVPTSGVTQRLKAAGLHQTDLEKILS